MKRRDFLKGMLAACAAPAIVKAENIMRVRSLDSGVLVPDYLLGEPVGVVRVYSDARGVPYIVDAERFERQLRERTQVLRRDINDAIFDISPAEVPFTARMQGRF